MSVFIDEIIIIFTIYIRAIVMNKNKSSRQDLRVLQRNMIYCSGLPSNITSTELMTDKYFGVYGKVQKIVKNPFPNRNYCSVYITYSHQFEAATAILTCNQFQIGRSTLWCLFGTMKYCKFFLKKIQCKNLPNCPYLHALDPKNEVQIQASPSEAFPEHEEIAKRTMWKHPKKRQQLKHLKKIQGFLPQPVYALQIIGEELGETDSTKMKSGSDSDSVQKQWKNEQQQGNRKNITEKKYQEKQEKQQKGKISLDSRLKKLILRQLQQAKGSRLHKQITREETVLKQIIIKGLNQ